jgi:chloramphenicol 3-O phosphotransferase
MAPGWIVILNGVPGSGKSSIAAVIQERFEGVWMRLGVDVLAGAVPPPRYRPGMGLRPGGERPDLEQLLPSLFGAFYDSIAAHSRHGLNVVVDVGHHDADTTPLALLADGARRLAGLPALLVGVRCPVDVVCERRAADAATMDGGETELARRVAAWDDAVHAPGRYDLELDTSSLTPEQCADRIAARLRGPRRRPSTSSP